MLTLEDCVALSDLTHEDIRASMRSDYEKWGKVVKEAVIKLN